MRIRDGKIRIWDTESGMEKSWIRDPWILLPLLPAKLRIWAFSYILFYSLYSIAELIVQLKQRTYL